ncbi:hypothetical protein DPEC_G00268000 [Dallia pectoralis]|uniref:Uncharacterized protein n=1 Tax=Dallia pectoralis TaxID=75939 RepID=A0ACC2FNM1_DALPE|nr:hypothetical protein DPEC_G00268000 [Dallia pectoralis]
MNNLFQSAKRHRQELDWKACQSARTLVLYGCSASVVLQRGARSPVCQSPVCPVCVTSFHKSLNQSAEPGAHSRDEAERTGPLPARQNTIGLTQS